MSLGSAVEIPGITHSKAAPPSAVSNRRSIHVLSVIESTLPRSARPVGRPGDLVAAPVNLLEGPEQLRLAPVVDSRNAPSYIPSMYRSSLTRRRHSDPYWGRVSMSNSSMSDSTRSWSAPIHCPPFSTNSPNSVCVEGVLPSTKSRSSRTTGLKPFVRRVRAAVSPASPPPTTTTSVRDEMCVVRSGHVRWWLPTMPPHSLDFEILEHAEGLSRKSPLRGDCVVTNRAW